MQLTESTRRKTPIDSQQQLNNCSTIFSSKGVRPTLLLFILAGEVEQNQGPKPKPTPR